jgi:hypothetical protein
MQEAVYLLQDYGPSPDWFITGSGLGVEPPCSRYGADVMWLAIEGVYTKRRPAVLQIHERILYGEKRWGGNKIKKSDINLSYRFLCWGRSLVSSLFCSYRFFCFPPNFIHYSFLLNSRCLRRKSLTSRKTITAPVLMFSSRCSSEFHS